MSFFNAIGDLARLINGSVGNNLDNEEDDVRAVRTGFKDIGFTDKKEMERDHEDKPLGILTRNLDDTIRNFQKENNLRVDGYMEPGGETESALATRLAKTKKRQQQQEEKPSQELYNFGGRNFTKSEVQNLFDKTKQSKPLAEMLAAKKTQSAKTGTGSAPPAQPPIPERKPSELDLSQQMTRPAADQKTTPPPTPERKPEIITPTKKGNELLNFIGKLESSDNYNVIYGGDKKPLTKMTVKEVYALQKNMLKEGRGSSVVGRYQFKHDTLKETVDKLGIDENAIFDEKLQDRLARSRMEYRGFEKYKVGKISTEELIKALANEWASLPPDPSNKSRYEGVLNNRALTNFETLKALLEKR